MGGDTFCVGEVGASGVLLIVVAAGVLALVSVAAVVVVEVEVAVGEVNWCLPCGNLGSVSPHTPH